MKIIANLERDDRQALKEKWEELIGTTPSPNLRSNLMLRIVASELQWRSSGHSQTTIHRKLRRLVKASKKTKPAATSGARLVRTWNGKEHVVDVVSDGYLWNGKTWGSLSAIAKEITGTKWSGPRFFGVAA